MTLKLPPAASPEPTQHHASTCTRRRGPEANVTEPLSPTVAVPVDKDNDPLTPDVPASSDERLTSPDEVSTPCLRRQTQVSSIATTRRTSIERSCTPSIAEESPATSDIDPPLSDDEALPMTLKLPPAASPEPTLNTMLPPVPDAEEPEANVTEPLSPTVAVPVDKDNDPLTGRSCVFGRETHEPRRSVNAPA
eukprot:g8855.t1 g8855   contig34:280203-280866(+)